MFSHSAAYHVDELDARVRLGFARPDVPDQSSVTGSCPADEFEPVSQSSFERRIIAFVVNDQFFETACRTQAIFNEQIPLSEVFDQPVDSLVPDDILFESAVVKGMLLERAGNEKERLAATALKNATRMSCTVLANRNSYDCGSPRSVRSADKHSDNRSTWRVSSKNTAANRKYGVDPFFVPVSPDSSMYVGITGDHPPSKPVKGSAFSVASR